MQRGAEVGSGVVARLNLFHTYGDRESALRRHGKRRVHRATRALLL